jgi:hypothetical protein
MTDAVLRHTEPGAQLGYEMAICAFNYSWAVSLSDAGRTRAGLRNPESEVGIPLIVVAYMHGHSRVLTGHVLLLARLTGTQALGGARAR